MSSLWLIINLKIQDFLYTVTHTIEMSHDAKIKKKTYMQRFFIINYAKIC